MLKSALMLLGAAALVFAGDSSRYKEDFHYSYPQSSGGRFSIENYNGSVEITGWDQNTVDVSGTKYASSRDLLNSIKIEVSNSGNSVRVRTERAQSRWGNSGAKYIIRVPRHTELENVQSSNGSLRVEEIDGNAHVATSNGSVRLTRIHGNVDGRTSNGSAEVRDVSGSVTFKTSNGSVHGDNLGGALEASTSNGGIHVHLTDAGNNHPVRVSTTNGSIDLQVDSPREGDVVASTSNGPIVVRMPASIKANLHAATNSGGSVRSDFDILVHGGDISKHRMDGAIGGGGPRIELTTSNGNISLIKI